MAIGTVWQTDTWGTDTWADDTWADAAEAVEERVVSAPEFRPSGWKRPPAIYDEKAKAFFMAYAEENDIEMLMIAIVQSGILE